MRLFENLYKDDINKFNELFITTQTNIANGFQHKFLTKRGVIKKKITCNISMAPFLSLSFITKWISDNPFMFNKLLNNEILFKAFLAKHDIVPLNNAYQLVKNIQSSCKCKEKLCIHAKYSFFILDNLIEQNVFEIFNLRGIYINDILNKVACEMLEQINLTESDRTVKNEDIYNFLPTSVQWKLK